MWKILFEKFLAALVTFLVVSHLHWSKVVLVYIVLGQGHFLSAYLYQYKAGKVNRNYILVYLTSAIAIISLYWWNQKYNTLVCLTTIYFLAHMLWDELYLLRLPMELKKSPMCLGRSLEMAPIFLLYSARVTEALFPSYRRGNSLLELALKLCLLVFCGYLVLLIFRIHKVDWKSAYFVLWGSSLAWASYTGLFNQVPTGKLTGFIIIYHYLAWYFHYFLNLTEKSRKRDFILRITGINAVVISGYLIWGQRGPGAVFFRNDNFYIWTLLHLISSTRLGDLKGLFRLRPS